jgi:SpoVK/Ycf46/Vps4 family AAA+-type ATPase
MKNLVAVQTGPDSNSQVAAEPTLGVTDGKKKMCFALRETYDGCIITVYGKTEEDTDDFLGWLGQQVKQHNFLKKAKIDGKGAFLKLGEYTWDDIILRKGIREKIESNIMDLFRQEEVYLTNGIPPKRGFALVGPPGTGKTLLTKIMAWALKDVTFIWITPSSIYGSGSISDFYELAQELAPTIVFFEDADVYLGQRGTMESSGGILTELMNRLDGIVPIRGVVTGLSSNRPEVLESALIRRPGRFDMVLELGPPDDEGRLKLLRKYFEKPKVSNADIEKLAADERTHGMEPCKLEEIVRRAILKAIEKGDYDKKSLIATITWQHMQDGLTEYLQEQSFRSSYVQHESHGSMTSFSEALNAAGLRPLNEQIREEEDKIRDFVKLIAPEGLSDDDLFENPISDNEEVLDAWEEVLNDVRMLRRFGVSRSGIRSAKKIYDNEDVTGQDVIRMLTGEE